MGDYFILEREKQVCTLATAVRLKELGAPQGSHRKWFIVKDSILNGGSGYQKANLSNDLSNVPYSYCEKDKLTKEIKVYAAYDASEAAKLLPGEIEDDLDNPGAHLVITKDILTDEYECQYCGDGSRRSFKYTNLAEALCQLAIHLFLKGILKPVEGE